MEKSREALKNAIPYFESDYYNFEELTNGKNKSSEKKAKTTKIQNLNSHFIEQSKSDEELELELLQAVQVHLQNKPIEKKPILKFENKISMEDLSKYVSQGAIPKILNKEKKNNRKTNKSKRKQNKANSNSLSQHQLPKPLQPLMSINLNLPKNNLVTENFNGYQDSQNNPIGELRKNEVAQLCIKNPSQPFLYIIPHNPSPYFTLPPGNYFVTAHGSDFPPVSSIISHPEISTTAEFITLIKENGDDETLAEDKTNTSVPRNALSNLGITQTTKLFRNNVGCFNITQEDNEDKNNKEDTEGDLKFSKSEEMENALLLGNFDKIDIPIEVLQSCLQGKINRMKAVLENLNLLKITEKIEPDLFSKNIFYNKQFEKSTSDVKKEEIMQDQFFVLDLLFPNSDHEVLRQEVEECNGREDSFLKLIKKKLIKADGKSEINAGFKFLLSNLPNHDVDILYYKWLDCLGNKEKLKIFVVEEKKILEMQQIILTELPELNLIAAKKKAENFLNDESAWDRFLAERRLMKQIEEQFSKLIVALPDNDPAELMAKCQELQGEEDLINEYIIHTQHELKKEAHFLSMKSVLPDAQPGFLKEKIEELQGDDNAVNVLTNSLLEKNDYPKVEMDIESIERQKLWENYVHNFDVKDFLLETDNGKILDFNDNNEQLVLEFFKTRYPTVFTDRLNEIELIRELKILDMFDYCEDLDENVEFIELCCSNFKNSKFTKTFLQKVVYIDKRYEIERYLQESKDRKKAEEFQAREQNAFLECPLCCENEVVESDAGTCSEGHVFCKNCIRRYIEVKVGDGIYKFQCISENCNGFFSLKLVSEILPKFFFQKISFKIGAEEISKANVEGLEFCTACDFAYIPLPEEKIFFCQNPGCLKEICRNCREDNHIPLRCEEIEREKDLEARKKIEEAMSEKLIRFCPKCGKKFVKQDGCNKMTCLCGEFMCYICNKSIKDYSHFSDKGGKCPLYSNNNELHHTDVINAGIAARNQILQEDPNIKILYDPTQEN